MYVRTKDGVYDTSKGLYTPSIKMYAIGIKTIYEDDILKQAETIEELCDEFVALIQPDNYEEYGSLLSDYDDMVRLFKKYPKNIFYGAIWTKWGLKYVAKMNDKGELELI